MAITFITPDEQRKFGRIETLIESTIRKQAVPAEIGESFEYNPERRGKSNNKFRNRRKGGFKGKKKGGNHQKPKS